MFVRNVGCNSTDYILVFKMEVTGSSETSVAINQTTLHRILEDSNLDSHHRL
jgi:hypothetical protein